MEDIILLTILIVGAIYIIYIKIQSRPKKGVIIDVEEEPEKAEGDLPYKKKYLLTRTEYIFFKILKPACDNADIMICPKVRLEDLAEVTDKANLYKWRGYIKSRHVDFILTDNKLNVLAAIELDDSSHNSKKVQNTDTFKNNFFKKIGIPLFRIRTGQDYNEAITNIITALKAQDSVQADS